MRNIVAYLLLTVVSVAALSAQTVVRLYPDSKNRSERKVTLECYPVSNPKATVVV